MADERVITMAKQLIKHSVRLQPGEAKSAFLERARNALLALQQPIGAST